MDRFSMKYRDHPDQMVAQATTHREANKGRMDLMESPAHRVRLDPSASPVTVDHEDRSDQLDHQVILG